NAGAPREKANSDRRAALRSRQGMQLLAKCRGKYPALSTPRPSSGNRNDTVAVNCAPPPQQREAENLPGASTSNKGRTFRDGRRPRLSKQRVKVKRWQLFLRIKSLDRLHRATAARLPRHWHDY